MRAPSIAAACAALALSGCVAATPSQPVATLDRASLVAAGQAVVVSRGAAFAELGVESGAMTFGPVAGRGASINLLTSRGFLGGSDYGYGVRTVTAGSYQLKGVQIGRLENTSSDPLSTISLAAGDVIYVGDIELRPVAAGLVARNARATVTDRTAAAQAALAAQAPALSGTMRTQLLRCVICIGG